MRRALLCWLAISLLQVPCVIANPADRKPVTCAAAKPYQGPPLHAALPEEVFAGVAGALDGVLAPALAARLDAAADWILQNTTAPGLTAAVGIPGQGLWSTSRGLLVAEPSTPLPERPLFHWASAGKAFTAVVVSQLTEAGRLRYDDPLAKWFPKFPNAAAITVDHLLTHTSGTFSFQADLELRRKTGYKAPAELLRVAARHGSDFCPGEHWAYSNTGYVLLGRIVEEIEGKPFHEVVRERILDPLRLEDTVALAPRQKPPGLTVGHRGRKPDRDFEVTTPFSAGNIAAPARDLVLFWQAVLSGRLVRPETVRQAFARLYPMFDPKGPFYGRGVMVYDLPAAPGAPSGHPEMWLGHSGGTESFKSVVAYDPGIGVFVAVAVALNGDVPAEAAANKLLGEVRAFRAQAAP